MKLKDQTKERKIMDATIDIVHTKGLMGVKMSEVAKRVKISPSNLYIYFKNKEDLLTSTFFDTAKNLVKQFEKDIPDHAIYKKKIYGVFEHMLQIKVNKKEHFSFMHQFVQSPFFQEKHLQQMDLIVKNMLDVFRSGQKDMILKDDIEVELIFAVIDGTTSKLLDFHNTGKINLNKKTIDKSFRMIWDAIRQ